MSKLKNGNLTKEEKDLLLKLLIKLFRTTDNLIIKSHAKGMYIKLLEEDEEIISY